MKRCWKCATEWGGVGQPAGKAACDTCGQDLHACRNCVNFDPHAAHECREPGVDPIIDKERFNYCEEFQFIESKTAQPTASSSEKARAAWNNLFKKS